MNLAYSFLLISVFISVVSNQVYDIEDKLLPLKKLSEINVKFLQSLFSPITGVSHLTPYRHGNEQKLNSTHFDQLLRSDNSTILYGNKRVKYSKCSDDLVQILYNLNTTWALKMLDSNGKFASGILLGAWTWPGGYRECNSVYSPFDEEGRGNFHGKYCTVKWNVSIPKFPEMNINTGMCIPDSCGSGNLENVLYNTLRLTGQIPFLKKYISVLTLDTVACKSDPNPPDAGTITYVFLLCLFLLLVLLGSSLTIIKYYKKPNVSQQYSNKLKQNEQNAGYIYGSIQIAAKSEQTVLEDVSFTQKQSDVTVNEEIVKDSTPAKPAEIESFWKRFLECFSAIDNASKVLKVNDTSSQLQTIHGIRFLSLTWIILGHSYIFAAPYISNKSEVLEDIDNLAFQMVLQAPFAVDSFFVLSGLLLSYLFMKEADKKNGKISWLYFYIHRFWRLSPVYLLVVGFYMLVFKYLGSGPFWNEDFGDSDRHTWWYYVLYINNFIPIKKMCLGWSWYLANDMQFYVISPIFLYPLWRWPKIGVSVALSLLFASWVTIGTLTSQRHIAPLLSGIGQVKNLAAYEDEMWRSFDVIYDRPYCRIGPYIIGVLCGYLLYKAGTNKRFLQSWHQIYGWIGATFYALIVIFGLYKSETTDGNSIAYNALSRTAFAIALCWLIFACETGHGGLITKLLSLNFWVPLSRLTYCAYLVHPILIHGYYMGLPTMIHFTQLIMVSRFLGLLLISYALAFVVSICFESPMMNVEKLLLKKR